MIYRKIIRRDSTRKKLRYWKSKVEKLWFRVECRANEPNSFSISLYKPKYARYFQHCKLTNNSLFLLIANKCRQHAERRHTQSLLWCLLAMRMRAFFLYSPHRERKVALLGFIFFRKTKRQTLTKQQRHTVLFSLCCCCFSSLQIAYRSIFFVLSIRPAEFPN